MSSNKNKLTIKLKYENIILYHIIIAYTFKLQFFDYNKVCL